MSRTMSGGGRWPAALGACAGTGFRAAAVAVLVTAGCSSSPSGLGRAACPYLRPRLIRLDADRARLPGAGAAADMSAVSDDVTLYVAQLPYGGKGRNDRLLVAFSVALARFVAAVPGTGPPTASAAADLDTSEQSLAHECRPANT